MSTRGAAVLRAAVGAGMLSRPDLAARVLGARPSARHPVLRLLGARHVLEAGLLLVRPTRPAVTGAVAVDGAHVASCVAYAALSGSDRRPALRDALFASGLLLVTALSRPSGTWKEIR